MRHGQQGITLIGFILILIVLGIFAYLVMLVVPMYSEFYSIQKALAATVKEPGINTMDEYVIRDKISRHFEVSYIYSIDIKDVKIKRTPDGDVTLSIDYESKKEIGQSPIYVMGHFVDTESTNPALKAKAGAAASP